MSYAMVELQCEACSATFQRRLMIANRQAKQGRRVFCSRGCANSVIKKKVKIRGYREAARDDGSRVLEHRLVVENHIGRRLRRNEQVHHINGNKTDNAINNLEVLSPGEHSEEHWGERLTWNLDRAIAMYREGATIATIGRRLRRDPTAISRVLVQRGVHVKGS